MRKLFVFGLVVLGLGFSSVSASELSDFLLDDREEYCSVLQHRVNGLSDAAEELEEIVDKSYELGIDAYEAEQELEYVEGKLGDTERAMMELGC